MTEPRTESGNLNQVHLLLEEKQNTNEDEQMTPNDSRDNSQEGDGAAPQIDFSTEKNSVGPPLHATQLHKGSDARSEKT